MSEGERVVQGEQMLLRALCIALSSLSRSQGVLILHSYPAEGFGEIAL